MEFNFYNYTIRWQMAKSTNVYRTLLREILPFQKYKNFKFVTCKKVKVTEYSYRKSTIRWQMSKSTNVSHSFCASSYRLQEINILTFLS